MQILQQHEQTQTPIANEQQQARVPGPTAIAQQPAHEPRPPTPLELIPSAPGIYVVLPVVSVVRVGV